MGRVGKFVSKSTDFHSVYKSLKVETETLMINYQINDQSIYVELCKMEAVYCVSITW